MLAGMADFAAKGRVLQAGPLRPSLTDILRERYDALVLPEEERERDTFLRAHGREVIVMVTSGKARVDAALLNALPELGAVVNFGVGYDAIDVDTAAERGIGVSNTPDVLTDCVADAAVGLLIDAMRRLSAADRYVRAGRWSAEGDYPLAHRVHGSRVGILGLGRIGRAIAKRLSAFDCHISYHNRHQVDGSPYRYVSSPVDLAREVDVLVVAAAGGADTRNLVDATVLDALGPDGFLVNIARGSVVDQQALIEALRSGRLAGAGLDVYTDEPDVPEALRALDNAVLLPHVGSATEYTRAAMQDLTLRNLDLFLSDGELVTPVIAGAPRG